MLNFDYSIPTEIFFGKGQIKKLPENAKKYGKRILLVYGGGSILRTGLHDVIVKLLNENNFSIFEISGVKPNPRVNLVNEGAKICKDNNVDIVLAVGGGSVIDTAKVIAAAAKYDGDAWDIVLDPSKIKDALAIISVLTLSATGSEMDDIAVISKLETNQKLGLSHKKLAPKFSILDPEYTYSVPPEQTAAGTADILSHIFEVYFSNVKGAYIQNRMSEALIKTCIKYGPIAMKEAENYDARANLMWASSLAINKLLAYGKDAKWSIHPIEHELSAYFDITHGIGLAIIIPQWLKYMLNETTLWKFVEYGVNVWDIDKNLDELEIAELAIKKTADFLFEDLKIPAKLRDIGVEEYAFNDMTTAICNRLGDKIGNFVPIDADGILKILRESY